MKSIHPQIVAAAAALVILPVLTASGQTAVGNTASSPGATATNPAFGQSVGGTNPNTTPATPATANSAVLMTPGFYSTGGHVYRIENGRATPVTEQQTMRISPQGIIGFDGKPLNIPAGQMISADGRLVPLPSNVSGLPNTGTGAGTGTVPGAPGLIGGEASATAPTGAASPGTGAATNAGANPGGGAGATSPGSAAGISTGKASTTGSAGTGTTGAGAESVGGAGAGGTGTPGATPGGTGGAGAGGAGTPGAGSGTGNAGAAGTGTSGAAGTGATSNGAAGGAGAGTSGGTGGSGAR